MKSDYLTDKGLSNGRQWTAVVNEGQALEWSIDASAGRIQGPLDLQSMRGQKMSIVLKPDQMAFLMSRGKLKAVYLDGAHYIDVGKKEDQVHPDDQLVFVAFDEPVADCALRIERPSVFFETFLMGQATPDAKFTVNLIEQIVHGVLERDNTSLDVMNQSLEACGLRCTRVPSPEPTVVPQSSVPVGAH
ncbi:MAG: hypothetical protein ACI9UK_001661 [Candidatus Krumholzibacteriia bacterium]|jgi:hypothetical protein